jgi:hypothetical protein
LTAQAVANDGYLFRHGFTDQITNRGDPGEGIIHTHRPTHKTKPGKGVDRNRYGFAFIKGNQLPWNPLLLKEYGKIARTFSGGVTKDGNWAHGEQPGEWNELPYYLAGLSLHFFLRRLSARCWPCRHHGQQGNVDD